ncbi:MAG TPA: hypothetical protein PJ991_06505 [Kiritimatiellia bacterium]|nr:hypothetical protein [Kiritimatiellia bacterium]
MSNVKVTIAGQDQSELFRNEVDARYDALINDSRVGVRPGSLDVGLLSDQPNPEAMDRAFVELLRHRSQIDTLPFDFPRKPGRLGKLMFTIRAFLWKLLRYQHDRMSSRQNRVNAWIINHLEAQINAQNEKIEELRKQIERLSGGSTGRGN